MDKYKYGDWDALLTQDRLNQNDKKNSNDPRSPFIIDSDRLIFSHSFRQLSRKTQVHPMSENDYIHTRLSHSLEVATVGRSIGKRVGIFLKDKNLLPDNFEPTYIGEILYSACLAHDIGNPPFGHAGEFAIRNWFCDKSNSVYLDELEDIHKNDFKYFDGNAQSFRVVSVLEHYYKNGGMSLTLPTLATMIKYPYTSSQSLEYRNPNEVKFSYFESEKEIFFEIFSRMGLVDSTSTVPKVARHPLSYIAEAADDISYSITDLEDAVDMDLLKYEDIKEICSLVLNEEDIKKIDNEDKTIRRMVGHIRGKVIAVFVNDVVESFANNFETICGHKLEYGETLISLSKDRTSGTINKFKKTAKDIVYKEKRKILLEIGSYTIFKELLNAFIPAIYEFITSGSTSYKSQRALDLMGDYRPSKDDDLYASYQSVIDYISGMTDNRATYVASHFSGRA